MEQPQKVEMALGYHVATAAAAHGTVDSSNFGGGGEGSLVLSPPSQGASERDGS